MNLPSWGGMGAHARVPAASFASLHDTVRHAGADALSRLQALLSLGQATRLLQMETALPSTTLVVERLHLTEAVHAESPLWAEVDCLSTSAHLPLKALNGEQVSVRLMQADGQWRTWHGYVVRAAQLGADGGLARYRLSLAAWTHWLTLRRDTRIFQDQTAADIVSDVMAAYPQAHFRLDVRQPGPVRPITTQYRETDWAFVQRLMAEEGWSWRLTHQGAPTSPLPGELAGARAARHTLVVFDAYADAPDLGPLRFSRPDMRGAGGMWGISLLDSGFAQDTITAWREGQQLTPNVVTLASWDERQVAGVSAQARQTAGPGHVPELEDYRGHGERCHADGRIDDPQIGQAAVAEARAAARLAARTLPHRFATGDSAVRTLHEGAVFALTEHSLYGLAAMASGQNRFQVLSVTHEAANNLGSEAATILRHNALEQGSYRNHFTAVPVGTRLLPPIPDRPTAPGPQTATVVAQPGEPLTTDRDGRIRIQFAWQRGEAPLPGALTAPESPTGRTTGHAPGDARSGTWVRVAQSLAGPNWGTVFTPRAGTEVLVSFMDGDIDRPVVVGQLHNGQHDLPWPAGVDAGANHGGVLSGWHSTHLDGQGANQWLLDDSAGQLRMRLVTHGADLGWSELSLGHLVQQSGAGGAGHAHRGAWLGSGFYGVTDGWAVLRAGQGLLLTTSPRPARGSSVHSTQMDAAETVSQLRAARQLGDALSHNARQQGAQGLGSHDANQAVQQHADAMDPAAQGHYSGTVGGQPARKADGRTLTDPVECFAKPLLHLDTPVSASIVAAADVSLFSGQDTSLSTHGDLHCTSGHTFSAVSGQTTSLYTHSGGIQAITAKGALSVRAHTDAQQIWADQDLTVQSTTDEIRIQASRSITLTAGQSQIELKGGDITFTCPGTWTVKGAMHEWGAGGGGGASLMALPSGVSASWQGRAHAAPSLASPLFSEALGFSDYPAEWLPFSGAKSVEVLDGDQTVGHLLASPTDEFTASLITADALHVRYVVCLAAQWSMEQDIQIAESENDSWRASSTQEVSSDD
ncbi:type VI secretion system Vgr family protein [Aquabacterium sp.]|uniref:type VI secretion system Vgr family protein n=1 Tax=Aquabacterium sp. TaxID=1872578 RepID=UPI003B6D6E22